MENLIAWLEKQIEGCNDLGGMEKEKWAFIQTLKKVRKEQLTIHSVVGRSEQIVLFARFISNNSKLTTWMTSEELLAEFKKQN